MRYRSIFWSGVGLLFCFFALVGAGWTTRAEAASSFAVGVILSVERYESDSIAQLEFAKNDASAMRTTMKQYLGVPDGNFVDIVAPTFHTFKSVFGLDGANRYDKTEESELKAMVRRVANGKTDGRVYVYLNAHGLPDRALGTAMILPQDANPTSTRSYGISLKEIENALKNIKEELLPDGEVILIVEACFSGYVGSAGKQVVPNTSFGPVAMEEEPSSDRTIIVLRAAQGHQTAFWDRNTKQGAFTEAVLQGLSGLADRAGGNGDGQITLKELTDYVDVVLPERLAANNHPVGGQKPVFRGGRSDLVVASLNSNVVIDDERGTARRREEAQCEQLSKSGTLKEIREFEATCIFCRRICGPALNTRRDRLLTEDAACQAARWRFDRAEKEKDIAVLKDLIQQDVCEQVKLKAQALLNDLTKPADPCAKDREALSRLDPNASRQQLEQLSSEVTCPEVKTSIARRIDEFRLSAEKERACEKDRETLRDIAIDDIDSLRALRARNPCEAIESELSSRIQQALDIQLTCITEQRRVGELERAGDSNGLRSLARTTRCRDVRQSADAALERVRRAIADTTKCANDKRQLSSTSKNGVEELARLAETTTCSDVAEQAREKWKSWLPAGSISAEAVQRALGWTGHLDAAFDGEFGEKSQTALANWQGLNKVRPTGDYQSMDDFDLARLLRDAERVRAEYGYSLRRDRLTGLNWGQPTSLVPSAGDVQTRPDGSRVSRYQAASGSPQITLLRGRGHVGPSTNGRPTLDIDPKRLDADFEDGYKMPFDCWWVKSERPYGSFCLGQDEKRQLYVRYRVVNGEMIGFIFRIDQTNQNLRALITVFSDDWAKNNPMPY